MSQNTLTRADLAEALAEEIDVSRQDGAALLESVLDLVGEALVAGETVKLSSFGAFSVRDKNERQGRNPKTGEPAAIDARRVLVFRASQILKDRVDQSQQA